MIDWELSAAVVSVLTGETPASLPRHRHSLPREEVERQQRARILVATAETVAELGYAASSVSRICARAGVSSRTFYASYASKEEAFLGLYVVLDAAIELFGTAAGGAATAEEAVAAGARSYLASMANAPTLARVLVIDAVAATPAIAHRRIEALTAYVEAIRSNARRFGLELAPELVMAFVGAANELVYQRLVTGGDLAEVEPVLVYLAGRVLAAPEDFVGPSAEIQK